MSLKNIIVSINTNIFTEIKPDFKSKRSEEAQGEGISEEIQKG